MSCIVYIILQKYIHKDCSSPVQLVFTIKTKGRPNTPIDGFICKKCKEGETGISISKELTEDIKLIQNTRTSIISKSIMNNNQLEEKAYKEYLMKYKDDFINTIKHVYKHIYLG